jgi:hypothetical protein
MDGGASFGKLPLYHDDAHEKLANQMTNYFIFLLQHCFKRKIQIKMINIYVTSKLYIYKG